MSPETEKSCCSLRRLSEIGEPDAERGDLLVGAGATLEEVQARARSAGLDFPLDLAARGTATIGGMAATNAGGAMAFRYGTMGRQVGGIETVLADGSIVDRLRSLLKDNAGYNLPALLVGSEGTLGVISRVRLRMIPQRARRASALCGLPTIADASSLSNVLQRHARTVESIDFFDESCMTLVREHRRLPAPLAASHPVYVIAECADDDDPTEELVGALERFGPELDASIADDSSARARLWEYRESLNEAVSARGVPQKLDVGVPTDAVGAFADAVRAVVHGLAPDAETYLWGHLGDGNVHVNVLGVDPGDERIEDAVLRAAVELGGTISSEHGVGLAKVRWLPLMRNAADITAMRALKGALDPLGVLSPGRVLAEPGRW